MNFENLYLSFPNENTCISFLVINLKSWEDMIRYGIKQQPTLEELSNLHLAGVVWQPSQLHHGVLAAVLRQAPPRPRVTGVLHLRVLRTDITLHYMLHYMLHYITLHYITLNYIILHYLLI